MAQKLSAFPSSTGQRYPWDEWLDGDPWQLVRGEDYDAKTATLISNARVQADKRDGTVRTRNLQDAGREIVILQFVKS